MTTQDDTACLECVRLRALVIELLAACQASARQREGCECERCAPCLARAAIDHAKDIKA